MDTDYENDGLLKLVDVIPFELIFKDSLYTSFTHFATCRNQSRIHVIVRL